MKKKNEVHPRGTDLVGRQIPDEFTGPSHMLDKYKTSNNLKLQYISDIDAFHTFENIRISNP